MYRGDFAFLGWAGEAPILRWSWNPRDEAEMNRYGPGYCNLLMIPIMGPASPWEDDIVLGDCYNASWILSPFPGVVAVVPGTGDAINFVDETTLRVTSLKTGRQAAREGTSPPMAWRDGDGSLVIVYGAPIAGSAVRVNLRDEVVVGAFGISNDPYAAGAVCHLTHTLPGGPLCVTHPPALRLPPTLPCASTGAGP
jgi:hypothetical protein